MEKLQRRIENPHKNTVLVPEILSENFKSFVKTRGSVFNRHSTVPNVISRSLMFSTSVEEKPGKKKWKKLSEIMGTDNQIEIWHMGTPLNQFDLNIYLYLLSRAGFDLVVRINIFEIQEYFGLVGGSSYDYIRDRLDNLQQAIFAFYEKEDGKPQRKMLYKGALLRGIDFVDGKMNIPLHTPLAALLRDNSWSYVSMNSRLSFGKKQKAMALHIWMCTHQPQENGFCVKKEYLKEAFGTPNMSMKSFMAEFKERAIQPLIEGNFITKVVYEEDYVRFWWDTSYKKQAKKNKKNQGLTQKTVHPHQ